jgi:hypothetical protein
MFHSSTTESPNYKYHSSLAVSFIYRLSPWGFRRGLQAFESAVEFRVRVKVSWFGLSVLGGGLCVLGL